MTFEFDMSSFEEDLQEDLRRGREAFEGRYKDELKLLAGLSRAEIDDMTPDSTDVETYDALMAVVKDASKKNLSQAALKANIEKLGVVGIRIAKKVSGLAGILV